MKITIYGWRISQRIPIEQTKRQPTGCGAPGKWDLATFRDDLGSALQLSGCRSSVGTRPA